MKLCINGAEQEVPRLKTISQLLVHLGFENAFVAVAKNGAVVSKKAHAKTLLCEKDDIEIVAPMQGG